MVASLSVAKIDLMWAEDQYWSTLLKVIGAVTKFYTPKEKRKLNSGEAQKYIR